MLNKRLVVTAGILGVTILPVTGSMAGPAPSPAEAKSTIAVIGDIPYGPEQLAELPSDIAKINADPDVSRSVHLGDIKNASSECSDSYFAAIKKDFDQFKNPLVYTPGDNEWTDCYGAGNPYLPTERLDKIRHVFFPNPGQTMGVNAASVETQSNKPEFAAFVENVMWSQSGVVFNTVNLPGSNNDLLPWNGISPISKQQRNEYNTRLNADLEWINQAFNRARQTNAKGVVLLTQADMWDASALEPDGDGLYGYDPIVQRIATLASHFNGPVLILEGDLHTYRVDHPFTRTDPLYALHPLAPRSLEAPNVTRVVVDGSSQANDYLKLTVDPHSSNVFSWTRVPYGAATP